jgi:hypothetical protein
LLGRYQQFRKVLIHVNSRLCCLTTLLA